MKTLLAFSLITLCFVACKKDNGGSNADGERYTPAYMMTVDPPVMYTAGATITDTALIREYLERRERAAYFSLHSSTMNGEGFTSFTLLFKDGNKVDVGGTLADITEQTNDLMLIVAPGDNTNQPDSQEPCDTMINLVPEHGPLTYPLLIDNGEYLLPYVIALISIDEEVITPLGPVHQTCTKLTTYGVRIFNEDMKAKLVAGGPGQRYDTLVVQTMRRPMIRQ